MPVSIKLSGFFDKAKRDAVYSQVPKKAARRFAAHVPEQQKTAKSGKTYKVSKGKGFRINHRASAKGEHPAVRTGKLSRSTKWRSTGTFSAEVTTVAKSKGFDYAAQLENKMGRPIQNAKEDLKVAQKFLDEEAAIANKKL